MIWLVLYVISKKVLLSLNADLCAGQKAFNRTFTANSVIWSIKGITIIAEKCLPLNTVNVTLWVKGGVGCSLCVVWCKKKKSRYRMFLPENTERPAWSEAARAGQGRAGCTQGANQMLCKGKNRLVK